MTREAEFRIKRHGEECVWFISKKSPFRNVTPLLPHRDNDDDDDDDDDDFGEETLLLVSRRSIV